MGKLKRVVARYERPAESYAAFVAFTCTMILVQFGHKA